MDGSMYVAILVDDLSCFKVIGILRSKGDAPKPLRTFIADFIAPQGLTISIVRTDNGGEFQGEFQRLLDDLRH